MYRKYFSEAEPECELNLPSKIQKAAMDGRSTLLSGIPDAQTFENILGPVNKHIQHLVTDNCLVPFVTDLAHTIVNVDK